ncbi:unnamed protein product [Rangifer tarandus platyrhynchus]|uniref:Uncharacterized protein n=1 Tax=Rangifer tarandus platyrhynchus TaxID=3082113 RepID=A0ABN8XJ74_RANTA|nr:unnamed protein product [Rangifer tarandus platyrhynchus]
MVGSGVSRSSKEKRENYSSAVSRFCGGIPEELVRLGIGKYVEALTPSGECADKSTERKKGIENTLKHNLSNHPQAHRDGAQPITSVTTLQRKRLQLPCVGTKADGSRLVVQCPRNGHTRASELPTWCSALQHLSALRLRVASGRLQVCDKLVVLAPDLLLLGTTRLFCGTRLTGTRFFPRSLLVRDVDAHVRCNTYHRYQLTLRSGLLPLKTSAHSLQENTYDRYWLLSKYSAV